MKRKLDRIYYDQAAADFLVYDDYNRRDFRNPGGYQPSYYLAPDGGYYDEEGNMRYDDFTLKPDYFAGPIFPPPPTSQAEGHEAQCYKGPLHIFGGEGYVGASSSGAGNEETGQPNFAAALASSIFGEGPSGGDPYLGGGKLMGGAFAPVNVEPMMTDDLVQGGEFDSGE